VRYWQSQYTVPVPMFITAHTKGRHHKLGPMRSLNTLQPHWQRSAAIDHRVVGLNGRKIGLLKKEGHVSQPLLWFSLGRVPPCLRAHEG
jgi:hypothetical protein